MKTTNRSVTLEWNKCLNSGDGKRSFVVAKENDGWKDLRIEVDTDDCDGEHAKSVMQVVINRCNSHDSLVAALKSLIAATDHFTKDDDTNYALNEARAALAKAKEANS